MNTSREEKKATVFQLICQNERSSGYAIANSEIRENGVMSGGKETKYCEKLKVFSYCVTVGCWRKKSRWGRPGPAGLKDHSDPAEETAGYTVCVFCFLPAFHRKTPDFRLSNEIAE